MNVRAMHFNFNEFALHLIANDLTLQPELAIRICFIFAGRVRKEGALHDDAFDNNIRMLRAVIAENRRRWHTRTLHGARPIV